MNRTLQAVIVLILAVVTLAVAWYGAGLRRDGQRAREEWKQLEKAVNQKDAEVAKRVSDEELRSARQSERSARRLALIYRLKKTAGKRAQAQATGGSAENLRELDEQMKTLEAELRELQKEEPAR